MREHSSRSDRGYGGRATSADAARPRSARSRAAPRARPAHPPVHRPARRRSRRRSLRRELLILIAGALVIAVVVRVLFVQAFFIPSESMQQTLLVGDRVLVNKILYDVRDIRRGEIVVFDGVGVFTDRPDERSTSGPFERTLRAMSRVTGASERGGKDFIKRVIGLPGDRVACCDDKHRLTVNGIPLEEKDYLFPGDTPSQQKFDVVVPDGRLWVMGDHRSRSADSRAHLGAPGGGTVPLSNVVGRAFVVVWPLYRARALPVPESFSSLDYGSLDYGSLDHGRE